MTLQHTGFTNTQQPSPMPGTLDLAECIAHLRDRVPDAIVTNGAGNFSAWVHRFWRWHDYPTQLAPTSGAATTGLRRSQASAICARVAPRASATAPTASTVERSLSALV